MPGSKFLSCVTLICTFFLSGLVLAQNTNPRTIIIVFDNSNSMKKAENGITQCAAANYALQIMVATLKSSDSLYIVLSREPGKEVSIKRFKINDKKSTIKDIAAIQCSEADMLQPLLKGISLFKSSTSGEKMLVLIGDGEWFLGQDRLTGDIKAGIIDDLASISLNSSLFYINTSSNKSIKNEFLQQIMQSDRLSFARAINTDASPMNLMDSLKQIIKVLLKIPGTGFNDYSISDRSITINNVIPLSRIFIIDQYVGNRKPGIGPVNQNTGIRVTDELALGQENIKATIYTIEGTKGQIQAGKYDIPIVKSPDVSRLIQVYAIAGIRDTVYVDKLKRTGPNKYMACFDDTEFVVHYALRASHPDESGKIAPELAVVSVRSMFSGNVSRLNFNPQSKSYTGNIPLSTDQPTETFVVISDIRGYYHNEHKITIQKSRCIDIMTDDIFDTVFFSLQKPDTIIVWKLKRFVVRDLKTGALLPEESRFITLKNELNGNYRLKTDKDQLYLIRTNQLHRIFGSCFLSFLNEDLQFDLIHPNAKQPARVHVHVIKTDTCILCRCWIFLLVLAGIGLLLLYIYKITTKPRFKKNKNKRRAKIEYYQKNLDNGYIGMKELKTGFINRYLNPFGPETKKVYGLRFIATRSTRIYLSGKSINDNLTRGLAQIPIDRDNISQKYPDLPMAPNVKTDIIAKQDPQNQDEVYYYYYKL